MTDLYIRYTDSANAERIRGYYDQEVVNQAVMIQLEILRCLKEICDRHGLHLYMVYGTLLGAVRHGGVIPGDDDIDVALTRRDYNKLLELQDEFPEEYFLQTPWNDDCFYGGYLKLRNKNTTAIHPQNWWVQCCEGIGIDIFPLDDGYADRRREKRKQFKIRFYQKMLYAKAYGEFRNFKDMPLLVWKGYKYFGKLFSREFLAGRLNAVMEGGDHEKRAPFGIYTHYGRKPGMQKLSRDAFRESILLKYEDMMLEAPGNYDEMLMSLYGGDYMSFAPRYNTLKRHGFYAPKVPYQKYKKRFAGLLKPLPERDIVLFGDERIFEEFSRRYGGRCKPVALVRIGGKCRQKELHGIRIIDFEDYIPENKEAVYPVICGIYFRKYEEFLREAGYRDYYFFVPVKEWILMPNPEYVDKVYERSLGIREQ